MNVSRRTLLKFLGGAALVIGFLPRVAFAARNSLSSLRTGVQPGNKTRLVIETTLRPSYTLSYPENKLIINLANTVSNQSVRANITSSALITSVVQTQIGDVLQITANLKKSITAIERGQILVLEPNGDNDYRLVLDMMAGTGPANKTIVAGTTVDKKAEKPTASAPGKQIIVIDAGHGGRDPGCIGRAGTREKNIVLNVAKKLKNKLDAAGYKTYLTRSTDVFLNLDTRAGIAEKYHADLFLSLHANANPSRAMQGFSIYTLSKKASDEEAQKMADAENASDKIDVDGFEKFSVDIRNALSALQQHAVAEMSVEYAGGVAKSLKNSNITQQPGPDVRHAPFGVLRSTIPGALLELGHLSNASEEKLLNTNSHQDKLATAILNSIKKYDFAV